MSTSLLMSDDLRGVLEDIAVSPKQKLFAGSFFRRMGRAFRGEDATVGVARAGLSAAERHLVTMHRRELALTLQQAFYAQFFAPGGPAGFFFPTKEPLSKEQWEDQARFARDTAPTAAFQSRTTTWLHRLLNGESLVSNTEYQGLLTASTLLVDSPRNQLYSGIVHKAFNRDRAAIAVLSPLITSATSDVRVEALRSMQNLLSKFGRSTDAIRLGLRTLALLDSLGRGEESERELAGIAFRMLSDGTHVAVPGWAQRIAHDHESGVRVAFKGIVASVSPGRPTSNLECDLLDSDPLKALCLNSQ